MKATKIEVEALASAENEALSDVGVDVSHVGQEDVKSSSVSSALMKLTFFLNFKGMPVADLHMGERRLIATTHPATIVGSMFAMQQTSLKVTTSVGNHTGTLKFLGRDEQGLPLPALKALMSVQPELCQFVHLAPDETYLPLLQGFDLFSQENWYEPNEVCDEYIRAAYHHLPEDVIKRPLLKPAPKGWKKTLKRRNGWIYFPFC